MDLYSNNEIFLDDTLDNHVGITDFYIKNPSLDMDYISRVVSITNGSGIFRLYSDIISEIEFPNLTYVANLTQGFYSCSLLTSVAFPKLQMTDNYYGIYGLQSAFGWCTKLKTISFPVLQSGTLSGAFYECWNLQSAIFPALRSGQFTMAFYDCAALSSISFPLLANGNFSMAFVSCKKLSGAIEFPQLSTGTFTAAFSGCTSLTELRFPALRYSNTNSFNGVASGATALTYADFHNLESAYGGFERAFYGCTNLNSADFDSLVSADSAAFSYAFYGTKLSAYFPSLEKIGRGAFYSAFAYASTPTAAFPKLTTIGSSGMYGAFYNCSTLSSINFNKLASIDVSGFGYAFAGCSALREVYFPALSYVYPYACSSAFRNCNNLSKIHFRADIPTTSRTYQYFSNWGCYASVYFDIAQFARFTGYSNSTNTFLDVGDTLVPMLSSSISVEEGVTTRVVQMTSMSPGYKVACTEYVPPSPLPATFDDTFDPDTANQVTDPISITTTSDGAIPGFSGTLVYKNQIAYFTNYMQNDTVFNLTHGNIDASKLFLIVKGTGYERKRLAFNEVSDNSIKLAPSSGGSLVTITSPATGYEDYVTSYFSGFASTDPNGNNAYHFPQYGTIVPNLSFVTPANVGSMRFKVTAATYGQSYYSNGYVIITQSSVPPVYSSSWSSTSEGGTFTSDDKPAYVAYKYGGSSSASLYYRTVTLDVALAPNTRYYVYFVFSKTRDYNVDTDGLYVKEFSIPAV